MSLILIDALASQIDILLREARGRTRNAFQCLLPFLLQILNSFYAGSSIKSTEWYENLAPKMQLDPILFAYDYLTRSGRVSHAEVRRRDPELAAAYEKLHPALDWS